MRILIIDDSEDGREVAEAILIAAGYRNVRTAGSAAEAYRFLGSGGSPTKEPSSVDLVLLDIVMPNIDGVEVCARLRKDPRLSDVPIIMVTSLADPDSLGNAFGAGATDYITKPLNHVELRARVSSALKLKSELDRRQARERELLQFMATWGDRRASHWIDEATGLFVGEVAEAYFIAGGRFAGDANISIIALSIDHLDAFRSSQGEKAAAAVVARVAREVRVTAASVGVVAAAYRDGTILLVGPELRSKPALDLAETLRASVSDMRIANPESITASHITASVAVVTGQVPGCIDRVHLLTRAISAVPRVAAAGGNRVLPEYA
jgi:sigma-B regulation protein RsbU (phosphoserine phosphatase)